MGGCSMGIVRSVGVLRLELLECKILFRLLSGLAIVESVVILEPLFVVFDFEGLHLYVNNNIQQKIPRPFLNESNIPGLAHVVSGTECLGLFCRLQKQLPQMDYRHANEIHTNKKKNSLWLGDLSAAEDREWLREKNIRTIFTMGSGMTVSYDPSVRHYQYSILDSKDEKLSHLFDSVSDKIDNSLNFGSTLVHCGAGVSRSATFVIAYLIKYHRMNFLSALKYVRKKRKQICPNINFEIQLKNYGLQLHSKIKGASMSKCDLPKIVKIPVSFTICQKRESLKPKAEKKKKQVEEPVAALSLKRYFRSETENSPKASNNSPGKSQQFYLKRLAQFRFGRINIGNWGFS